MPFYQLLDTNRPECWFENKKEARRVIKNLGRLRAQIAKEIPVKQKGKLLLATWNIRDLGGVRVPCKRLPESFVYIAEIISAFDLIALQEVNKDLKEFNRLREALGSGWGYFISDMPDQNEQNNERMVYLYDRSKVKFRDIAGELTLPRTKEFNIPNPATTISLPNGSVIKMSDGTSKQVRKTEQVKVELPINQSITPSRNFARTPYLVAFQSGWFNFSLCTAHIYYGNTKTKALNIRAAEISRLTKILKLRTEEELKLYGKQEHYIVLGDFNIHRKDHSTMKAFEENGFVIPEELQENPTTMLGASYYDQIAFLEEPGLMESLCQIDGTCLAGAFDMYKSVYRSEVAPYKGMNTRDLVEILDSIESNAEDYFQYMGNSQIKGYWQKTVGRMKDKTGMPSALSDKSKKLYFLKDWRTYQMSDHLPLWVQLNVDHSQQYLDGI